MAISTMLSEAKRRKQFGEAVEVLLAAALGSVGRGVGIAAEAAVLRAGRKSATVSEFVRFALDLRFGAGEGERVDGGVGVAELVEGFGEVDVAALVERFAEQKNGAAVGGRLLAKQIHGERHGVEHGGTVIAGLDAVELGDDLARGRR